MIGVVDIGGTKVAAGCVFVDPAHGDLVLRGRREEPTRPERGLGDLVRRVAAMLRELSASDELAGVAIGSTGPIDRRSGVFGRVDALAGFEGASLSRALRDALGAPDLTIVIENDADAAALGEATLGAGVGSSRFLYVTISTGIGGGLVVDGAIYRGAGGEAHPEIGHHLVEPSAGPLCACGARGCWEALASGPAMAAYARTLPGAKATTELTAESICDAARAGEDWARAVVDREAFYLGIGLTNAIAMYAPEIIALGGGVMKSAPLLLEKTREGIARNAVLVPFDPSKLVLAKLGGDAALIGAARAFLLQASTRPTLPNPS